MNIIICGLKGTGKTTLAKKIAGKLNFVYINDFGICKENINENEIFNFINKNDNFVLDLWYSLSPKMCSELKNIIAFYFGFVSIDENLLLKLLKDKQEKINLREVREIKKQSKNIQNQCYEFDLPFIDINKERQIIINETLLEINKAIKNIEV